MSSNEGVFSRGPDWVQVTLHQVSEVAVPATDKRRFVVSTVGGGQL